jgi:hypothetical protein
VVEGGVGEDDVYGEGGDDDVHGGDSSNDLVDGGPGRDEIFADGICFFSGCNGGGNDLIAVRDGEQDLVDCGGGYDTGEADTIDVLNVNGGRCEAITVVGALPRDAVPAPPLGGAPRSSPPPAANPDFTMRATATRRLVRIDVRCGSPCSIGARLLLGSRTLGIAHGRLTRAGSATLWVPIARKTARRLRGRRLAVRVTVTQARVTTTRTTRLTVRGNP